MVFRRVSRARSRTTVVTCVYVFVCVFPTIVQSLKDYPPLSSYHMYTVATPLGCPYRYISRPRDSLPLYHIHRI